MTVCSFAVVFALRSHYLPLCMRAVLGGHSAVFDSGLYCLSADCVNQINETWLDVLQHVCAVASTGS